jgi:hypothetical protein
MQPLASLVQRIRQNPYDYGVTSDLHGGAVLSIARYFGDERGTDALGLHLTEGVIAVLAALDAAIDIDEYDERVT